MNSIHASDDSLHKLALLNLIELRICVCLSQIFGRRIHTITTHRISQQIFHFNVETMLKWKTNYLIE